MVVALRVVETVRPLTEQETLTMNKLLVVLLTIVTAILHMLMGAPHVGAKGNSVTISSEGSAGALTCRDLKITFDDRSAVTAEETITLSRSEAPELRAKMPSGSGIHVVGSDRSDYSITACKAAADAKTLEGLSLSHQGGQLSVQGARGDDWVVYLLVKAPRGAALDLEAENGPIDLRDLSGTIRARTENGPLTVANCAGDIAASTQNGPISFSGGGHNVDLRAQNGPLSVKLEGKSWEGGSLTAKTQNGPLDLVLSQGFASGVQVEATGHSPFSCRARACGGAARTWDDDARSIHFGGGETRIHLSTVNGPVSIGSPGNEI